MRDTRFPTPGDDTRFPAPGVDTRFAFAGVDDRFQFLGEDRRFSAALWPAGRWDDAVRYDDGRYWNDVDE